MNKIFLTVSAAALLCGSAQAFSFKDIFTSENVEEVVSTVIGGTKVTTQSITGTWKYKDSAVKLESNNTLTEAAGSVATAQIENKLNSTLSRVGISSGLMTFTFKEDSTFSCSTKNRTVGGTYTINEDNTITLHFSAVGKLNIGSVTAHTELSIKTLSLLFDASKLMDVISAISSVTQNSTIISMNKLLQNYDGVLVGFDFTK